MGTIFRVANGGNMSGPRWARPQIGFPCKTLLIVIRGARGPRGGPRKQFPRPQRDGPRSLWGNLTFHTDVERDLDFLHGRPRQPSRKNINKIWYILEDYPLHLHGQVNNLGSIFNTFLWRVLIVIISGFINLIDMDNGERWNLIDNTWLRFIKKKITSRDSVYVYKVIS